MKLKLNLVAVIAVMLVLGSCKNKEQKQTTTTDTIMTAYYNEPYRPQFHFTPEEKWMNDPNGMVYYKGIYHLFYQYYPDDIVWGPMHWGHATSKDLVHWEHKPIALYPDENGLRMQVPAVLVVKFIQPDKSKGKNIRFSFFGKMKRAFFKRLDFSSQRSVPFRKNDNRCTGFNHLFRFFQSFYCFGYIFTLYGNVAPFPS